MTTSSADRLHTIYFYAPDRRLHPFFSQPSLSWPEIFEARKLHSGNFTSWILTTYLQLKKIGFDCEVIDHLPSSGIVLADRDTLGNRYPYLGKTFLICAKGDREFHPSAHTHVVHNAMTLADESQSLWHPYYIPHWSQPGIIPRAASREALVKNIAFMGTRSNLAKDFYTDKWTHALSDLDCNWMPIFSPDKWSDYNQIDAIVAVRSFDRQTYAHKPASKLVNCWRAGVPAILSPESAFLSIQESALDFQAISSIEDAIAAVKQLKENPALYLSMVNNGLNRAQEFSDEKITEHWVDFFQSYVSPEYDRWIKASPFSRWRSFAQRYARLKAQRVKNRLSSQLG